MRKGIAIALCIVLWVSIFSGALVAFIKNPTVVSVKTANEINPLLDLSKEVTLTLANGAKEWPQMDNVIARFEKKYPNCHIEYEQIEGLTNNIGTRLASTENKVDIFTTPNIQDNTVSKATTADATKYYLKDYAVNLLSEESEKYLDLSDTHAGIVNNYKYLAAEDTQYSIPIGGELRGMYVNKTLLKKFNLSVPKNRTELLHCCEVLFANGYIPFHSAPGTFAQQLLYPYICSKIVSGGQEYYDAVENIDTGISEKFRDPYTLLYNIVDKGYYNYKKVETDEGYNFSGPEGKARDFLNLRLKENSVDEYAISAEYPDGRIAFMPDTQSFNTYLGKMKTDYGSNIDYEFIMSPVSDEGGYAYLSPATALAINKNSDNVDWALEFFDFIFTPEINKALAADLGTIPNTSDAFTVVQGSFNLPADRVCDVGQVTFGYTFYKTVTTLMLSGYDDKSTSNCSGPNDMIGISKMNATKYMNAVGETYTLRYTLEQYMARLEEEFQKVKQARV